MSHSSRPKPVLAPRLPARFLSVFRKPLRESLVSVLPIMGIVTLLCFSLTPVSNNAMMAFLVGGILLIFGMGLFTLGSEMSMIPLGEYVGKEITSSRKISVIVLLSFLIGVLITVAEPDLQVLAEQVPSIPNNVIIWSVALGVGVFLRHRPAAHPLRHPPLPAADPLLPHRLRPCHPGARRTSGPSPSIPAASPPAP